MNATETDFLSLEKLLRDDCKCESLHLKVECSQKVTHRNKSCIFDQLICLNSALQGMRSPAYSGREMFLCSECGSELSDCWTIIPV